MFVLFIMIKSNPIKTLSMMKNDIYTVDSDWMKIFEIYLRLKDPGKSRQWVSTISTKAPVPESCLLEILTYLVHEFSVVQKVSVL